LDLFQKLAWLPAAPADFNLRLKAASADGVDTAAILKELAGHGLSELQLNKLARVLDRAGSEGKDLAPLVPLRVAIVGNATTDFLTPVLAGTSLRYGFAAQVHSAPYGQVIQELLDPASAVYAFEPDLVLVALDYRGLPLRAEVGDAEGAEGAVQAALDFIDSLRAAIEANSRAVAIFESVARPVETLFGSLDLSVPGTVRRLVDEFNLRLGRLLLDTPHLLLDTAGLAETVGLATWHDPVLWNLAKASCANTMLPLYADHIMRLVSAWRGKSRRGLVLDLDNTVWGGVIGDDGLDGIRIAEGDALGEAHRDVQDYALRLRERGVVLAVSSKNDDDVARMPFRDHAEMLLREEHIAVFQANWHDKATNIQAIGDELALGVESFAFLDDNPAERGLVRENLPAVAVPELPEDAALYARTLSASGLFEAVTFSAEDRKRAEDYQSNAMRLKLQASVTDIDAYLRSLDMEITFRPFDNQGRARIAQLINKSNQFNLTTTRYSEADVQAMESDPALFTMQVRLKDRFADNGMISVIICRKTPDVWTIDTWLMSCRVLGRRVEQAVLQVLCDQARIAGARELAGTYIPTPRNGMVAQHYPKLGFASGGEGADGSTRWTMALSDAPDMVHFGKIDASGWERAMAEAIAR
jgi:FkbH-like protein